MSTPDHDKRIVIVGAGCFGLSTAYHLLTRGYTRVTVVDRAEALPAADAASTDMNKIVRSAYEDVFYAQLGQRAIEAWTTHPVWRPAYDQSGLVIVGYKDGFFDAAQAAGTDLVTLASPAALRAVYPPDLPLGTMITPIATYSAAAGSARAAQAVARTIDAVRALGGVVLGGKSACGTVCDDNGQLTGVKFVDGAVMDADWAVLAAGAWTASAFPELGLDKVVFASGQSIATLQLPPELAEVYRKCPISLSYNAGFYIFPPDEHGVMKIATHSAGYTHSPSPSTSSISTPRTVLTHGAAGLQIPTPMARAIRRMLRAVYPALARLPFAGTRLCWYTYANDEDWVIDAVEGRAGVFVATAGSGHGFKFLPVIGELIADRMEGRLAPEVAHKFSMSRDRGPFRGGYGELHEPVPLDLDDLCTDVDVDVDDE